MESKELQLWKEKVTRNIFWEFSGKFNECFQETALKNSDEWGSFWDSWVGPFPGDLALGQ